MESKLGRNSLFIPIHIANKATPYGIINFNDLITATHCSSSCATNEFVYVHIISYYYKKNYLQYCDNLNRFKTILVFTWRHVLETLNPEQLKMV